MGREARAREAKREKLFSLAQRLAGKYKAMDGSDAQAMLRKWRMLDRVLYRATYGKEKPE